MEMCAFLVPVISCISCSPMSFALPVPHGSVMAQGFDCILYVSVFTKRAAVLHLLTRARLVGHLSPHHSVTEFHGPNLGPCRGTDLQGPSCETHSAVDPQVGSSLGPTMRSGRPSGGQQFGSHHAVRQAGLCPGFRHCLHQSLLGCRMAVWGSAVIVGSMLWFL